MTGSTATAAGDTTIKAGSLLDDNQWHDVDIKREGRNIEFTVDRMTIMNMTNGDFYQLDLDRRVRIPEAVYKEKIMLTITISITKKKHK